MSDSKVDVATEADWSFYENDAVRAAVGRATRSVAGKFVGTVDVNDLEQDALLFLAVRPKMVAQCVATGGAGMSRLQWRVFHYLYERAEHETRRSEMEISSDPFGDWRDGGMAPEPL